MAEQFDLDRFLTAQGSSYEMALREMKSGAKRSHWIWNIFPQQKGLGRSWNSEYYGLDGVEEAKAYLEHPVLGARLREISQVLLEHKDTDVRHLMGSGIDALKLKSSMTLFDSVSPHDVFEKVLAAFF